MPILATATNKKILATIYAVPSKSSPSITILRNYWQLLIIESPLIYGMKFIQAQLWDIEDKLACGANISFHPYSCGFVFRLHTVSEGAVHVRSSVFIIFFHLTLCVILNYQINHVLQRCANSAQ